ncbi:MAG: T9SS type A sorting domain-containing protein [Candidatus Hatepunaea meridiana]|nr:T9SS type A sorting domain-containing protein [Candidatus Hatepunaea meridiana]
MVNKFIERNTMRITLSLILTVLISSSYATIEIEWSCVLDENTRPISFIQTDDRGFLIYGYHDRAIFTRIDSDIEIIWRRSWDIIHKNSHCEKLIALPDGHYVLVGNMLTELENDEYGESDIFLFEFNDNGDSLNYTIWESDDYVFMKDVVELDDGGYIFIAYIESNDHQDKEYIAIRVNSEGEVIWEETIQHPVPDFDLYDISRAADGNFLICGKIYITRPNRGNYGHILSIDSDGEILWRQNIESFSGRSGSFVESLTISNNSFAVIGTVGSGGIHDNIWYSTFNPEFENDVNKRIMNIEVGLVNGITLPGSNIFILTRIEDQNYPNDYQRGYLLVHINEEGDSLDSHFWMPDSLAYARIINTSDGGAAIVGRRNIHPRSTRYRDVIIKIAPIEDNDIAEGFKSNDFPHTVCLMPSYPNPFNSTTRISYELNDIMNVEVSIFNTLGQQIAVLDRGERAAGTYNLTWNADNVPSGIYFIKLITPTVKLTRKVLLVR